LGKRVSAAFTLIELLICIGIIAVVAGITFPIFSRVKLAAKERVSVSDMKQIAAAAMLYSQDWKSVDYGDMAAMGLPQDYPVLFGANGKAKPVTWPVPPMHPDTFPGYYFLPLPKQIDGRHPTWEQAALEFHDSVVLVCDPWFNNFADGKWSAYDATLPNRIAGISLGGTLVRKQDYGLFFDFTRWR
jgi:prepilin-type N-terminal cleavage/methylation domain-containing protein